jgi:hypothetical protein
MGTVTRLDQVRADRQIRADEIADRAAAHPALRWIAGETFWLAHRRSANGDAACGAAGDLVLAPAGVPLCTDCYPRARGA